MLFYVLQKICGRYMVLLNILYQTILQDFALSGTDIALPQKFA